ncbi:MAG TPA: hypothetical protein VNY52_13635, partial [Solirubrobacteraceae bacterium]|nr:hypothetical protein [Solirubrobacteraceae bacterium]
MLAIAFVRTISRQRHPRRIPKHIIANSCDTPPRQHVDLSTVSRYAHVASEEMHAAVQTLADQACVSCAPPPPLAAGAPRKAAGRHELAHGAYKPAPQGSPLDRLNARPAFCRAAL